MDLPIWLTCTAFVNCFFGRTLTNTDLNEYGIIVVDWTELGTQLKSLSLQGQITSSATCQGREININFSSEAHTTNSTEWPEPYACTRSNIARAAMDSCLVPIRARQHSIAPRQEISILIIHPTVYCRGEFKSIPLRSSSRWLGTWHFSNVGSSFLRHTLYSLIISSIVTVKLPVNLLPA